MAERLSAHPERRVGEQQPIIVDSGEIEFIIRPTNQRVYVRVTPEHEAFTRVEPLDKEAQLSVAQSKFSEALRNSIYAGMGKKAAESSRGSEFTPRQLELDEFEPKVREEASILLNLGRSDKELVRWVRRQGRMFQVGDEELAGLPSPLVNEQVERLCGIIRELVAEKARVARR